MQCRCPHCHNPIEIVHDIQLDEIECPSCGSQFSIVQEDKTLTLDREQKTLAHFELLAQVGVGKFGTVFKAKDLELDRIVAVKIPRLSSIDNLSQQQFLREARAAAQVKHENIVTVYEVGRARDTIYIASDFIDGASLKEFASVKRLTVRETASLVATIAGALHAAHQAGVIHRDLKPQNIMMDAEGTPFITDFGLAKRDAGEITMTADGAILGTPAYMSPEQAMGKGHHADRRSDVYSLGVILFELLTGELPFRGDVRMLLLQIQNDDPPRLIKLNSKIPQDIETICLKCMEKEPGERYATAENVRAELIRFVNGEPIVARPITPMKRGWRLVKRHPRISALMSVAILLLISLTIAISSVVVTQSNSIQLRHEKRRADREADRSKQNLITAARAIDQSVIQINENRQLKSVGLEELRKSLLESTISYLEEFSDQYSDDPELLQLRVRAFTSLGEAQIQLGDYEGAEANLNTAISLAKSIERDQSAESSLPFELSRIEFQFGKLFFANSKVEQAEDAFQRALEHIVSTDEDSNRYQFADRLLQADILSQLGRLRLNTEDDLSQALESFNDAKDLRETYRREQPTDVSNLISVCQLYLSIGKIHAQQENMASAHSAFESAVTILSEHANLLESDFEFLPLFSATQLALGDSYFLADRFRDAEKSLQLAIDASVEAGPRLSSRLVYTETLAQMRLKYSNVAIDLEENRNAAFEVDRAIDDMERFKVESTPIGFQFLLHELLNRSAFHHLNSGGYEFAIERYDSVLSRDEKILEVDPNNISVLRARAIHTFNQSLCYDKAGQSLDEDSGYFLQRNQATGEPLNFTRNCGSTIRSIPSLTAIRLLIV